MTVLFADGFQYFDRLIDDFWPDAIAGGNYNLEFCHFCLYSLIIVIPCACPSAEG
jgi:hypothetical protein